MTFLRWSTVAHVYHCILAWAHNMLASGQVQKRTKATDGDGAAASPGPVRVLALAVTTVILRVNQKPRLVPEPSAASTPSINTCSYFPKLAMMVVRCANRMTRVVDPLFEVHCCSLVLL
jgi:hypothetical protein